MAVPLKIILLSTVFLIVLSHAQVSAESRNLRGLSESKIRTESNTLFSPGRSTIIIACDKNFMPYTMQNSEGEPAGIFIEIWRLWARKTGYPIAFDFSDWNSTINRIKTGEVDIHSGLFINEQRRQFMDFSKPFYESMNSVFYIRKRGKISSIEMLEGESVGVIEGSDASNYLRSQHSHITLIEFDNPKTLIESALNGNIRAVADESLGFLWTLGHMGRAGDFKRMEKPLGRKKMVAAVSKGRRELLELIESGLDAISIQELDEIESRWIYLPEARYFRTTVSRIHLSDQEKAWLKSHGIVRIGVKPNYPPFEFLDKEKKYSGITSDYIRLLEKRLELDFQLIKTGWPIESVMTDDESNIDLFSYQPVNPEIRQQLAFSQSYLNFPIVIITQSVTQYIRGLEDLNGKQVAVVKGSSSHSYLQRHFPYIKLFPFETPYKGLYSVTTGKSFAFVGDLASATKLISKHGLLNLKVAASTPYSHELSFAIRLDQPELLNIINKGLESISLKEKNDISKRWLSIKREDDTDRAMFQKAIVIISVLAIAIILIILIWNYRIRKREGRFRSLTEKKVDITQAFSKNGIIVYQSPSHNSLLGYQNKELLGRSINDLLHQEDHDKWKESLSRLQEGEGSVSLIHRLRHKNGEYRFFESNCIDMTGDKDLKAIVINARDVTDRLIAEKEAQKYKTELEKRVRERTYELTLTNNQLNREVQRHEKARKQILNYQDSLRSLTSELALAEERERRKIAVDLHDHVSQKLALCRLKLGLLEKHTTHVEGRKILKEAVDLCQRSLTDTRNLTFEISPPSLYELGLEAALDELIEITQKKYSIQAKFIDDEQPKPMKRDMKITLYRIVSELIINTVKHAQADNLTVDVARKDALIRLTVSDDGIGFDSSTVNSYNTRTASFGLFSIRERLGKLGGKMDIISRPGQGTVVVLSAPLLEES